MNIGVVKEIKKNEYRVGLSPNGVKEYINSGHNVFVEHNAGVACGFSNEDYIKFGAKIVSTKDAWKNEMVIKVKEPIESEYKYFRSDLILYTYLHLEENIELTKKLIDTGTTSIAYESIIENKRNVLLTPMSYIAGKRAILLAINALEKNNSGTGLLPGGICETENGTFIIIGCGIGGYEAIITALSLNINVIAFDINKKRIEELKHDKKIKSILKINNNSFEIHLSNEKNIINYINKADALISIIFKNNALWVKPIITKKIIEKMKNNSSLIYVDQMGSVDIKDLFTSLYKPFIKYKHINYCAIPNMPSGVPKTSSLVLEKFSIKYGLIIARKDFNNKIIKTGINTINKKLVNKIVANILKI